MMKLTKLTKTVMALGALVLIGQAPLATAEITQPEKGVRCDSEKQACRDRDGLSVELTRKYYGDRAAQRVQRHLQGGGQAGGGGGGGGGDGQTGGGGGQAGGGGGRPNSGGQAGGGGGGAQGDAFSPAAGVTCVRSAQVCYSAGMPHPFYTAKYFGPGAASRISQ